jgi:hypothetical protein
MGNTALVKQVSFNPQKNTLTLCVLQLHAGFFNPEDGGDMYFLNVWSGNLLIFARTSFLVSVSVGTTIISVSRLRNVS